MAFDARGNNIQTAKLIWKGIIIAERSKASYWDLNKPQDEIFREQNVFSFTQFNMWLPLHDTKCLSCLSSVFSSVKFSPGATGGVAWQ